MFYIEFCAITYAIRREDSEFREIVSYKIYGKLYPESSVKTSRLSGERVTFAFQRVRRDSRTRTYTRGLIFHRILYIDPFFFLFLLALARSIFIIQLSFRKITL